MTLGESSWNPRAAVEERPPGPSACGVHVSRVSTLSDRKD